MAYIHTESGTPLTLRQIRERHPNLCWPASGPTENLLAELGYALLSPGEPASQPTWDDVRTERARRLAACDWTQLVDAPLTQEARAAWAAYRAALRDLPETYEASGPGAVVWPTPPT